LKLQTYIIALILSSASLPIMAASNPVDQKYQQKQAKKQMEQMKQQAAVKNVKLEPVVTAGKLVLPTVNEEFLIKSIHVDTAGETRFDWLQPMVLQYENQRYDVKNLDALVKYLRNQLVDYGYVTSTVVVPEQDLSSG
jgi:hemolysin activation/secretion protein